MIHFRTMVVASIFMMMAAFLSGCESMNSAMQDVKNNIAALDFNVPEIRPKNEGSFDANDEQYSGQVVSSLGQEEMRDVPESDLTIVDLKKECPHVTIVRELGALHQFTNPAKPSPESRISSIAMNKLETDCVYNKNNVVVELNLTFEGTLGAQAKVWNTDRPSFAYPYFMAITTPHGHVVAKEVFAAAVSYQKNQDHIFYQEKLRQVIPLNGVYDTGHSILMGFQLTAEELAYNRTLDNAMDLPLSSKTAEPERTSVAIKPAHKPNYSKETEGQPKEEIMPVDAIESTQDPDVNEKMPVPESNEESVIDITE